MRTAGVKTKRYTRACVTSDVKTRLLYLKGSGRERKEAIRFLLAKSSGLGHVEPCWLGKQFGFILNK